MTIEERVKMIPERRKQGYTCSQSVLCAYADLLDMSEEDLFRVSEGFGGGMGGMMLTCGAVSAMAMAVSLKNSSGDIQACDTKGSSIRRVRDFVTEFQNKNGSVICRELKGIDTGVVLRDCPGCIEDCIRILGERLFGLKE